MTNETTDARLADSCLAREHDIEQMASRLAQTLTDPAAGTNDDLIHEALGDVYVLGWRDGDAEPVTTVAGAWPTTKTWGNVRCVDHPACEHDCEEVCSPMFERRMEEVEHKNKRIAGLVGLASQMLDLLERNVIYSPRALANLRVHLAELKQGKVPDAL